MTVRILRGDCRDILRTLPGESVHCVVTSPPYWGLRDYGVDGQIGLEPTVQEFLAGMVDVFREVRRVLRADGTACVNMGDAYSSGGRGGNPNGDSSTLQGGRETQEASMVKRYPRRAPHTGVVNGTWQRSGHDGGARIAVPGIAAKQLIGQPWRLAFALQDDGWYLRQDIIWHKPNSMPESVRDRCTKAHEYLFLLAKSERYYYDAEAIKEPASENTHLRVRNNGVGWGYTDGEQAKPRTVGANPKARFPSGWDSRSGGHRELRGRYSDGVSERMGRGPGWRARQNESFSVAISDNVVERRNKRSVWSIPTAPFSGAHFATFPPALIEPCILAGCPAQCCSACGAPWERVTERIASGFNGSKYGERVVAAAGGALSGGTKRSTLGSSNGRAVGKMATVGFRTTCQCNAPAVPGVVLDPFGGAGTTGLVADRHGRDAILIELNPEYAEMAERRIRGDAPMFSDVRVA